MIAIHCKSNTYYNNGTKRSGIMSKINRIDKKICFLTATIGRPAHYIQMRCILSIKIGHNDDKQNRSLSSLTTTLTINQNYNKYSYSFP